MNILPLFTSRMSMNGSSTLTLTERGKTKPGESASIWDLAVEAGLKEVVMVEDRMDSYIDAFRQSEKTGVRLTYGIKFTVCANMADKMDESTKTHSKVIVFIKRPEGRHDLTKIWSRAATEGRFDGKHWSGVRADWKLLNDYWSEDNLLLALPWASSFLAKNTLTFNRIVPQLPPTIKHHYVFKEVESGLPFASLLDAAIDTYARDAGAAVTVVPVKSVYYKEASDFKALMVLRCIAAKTDFSMPNVSHYASDQFSFRAFQRLAAL